MAAGVCSMEPAAALEQLDLPAKLHNCPRERCSQYPATIGQSLEKTPGFVCTGWQWIAEGSAGLLCNTSSHVDVRTRPLDYCFLTPGHVLLLIDSETTDL